MKATSHRARQLPIYFSTLSPFCFLFFSIPVALCAIPKPVPLSSSQLCLANDSLNSANASGTVLFYDQVMSGDSLQEYYKNGNQPGFNYPAGILLNDSLTSTTASSSLNLSWSMSVELTYEANTTNQSALSYDTTLWLGSPPGINLYDGSNYYSGCAFVFQSIPENTLLRGQNDAGDCQETLDNNCITALIDLASSTGFWLTANPTGGPYSNLTPPILDYICGQIGSVLDSNPPSECAPFFYPPNTGHGLEILGATTSNTTTAFNETCYNQDSTLLPEYTLRSMTTFTAPLTSNPDYDQSLYDEAVRAVFPILTVSFLQANNSRQGAGFDSSADMTCLRANRYSKGSRVPPALSIPTPIHYPHPLSTGAKVGIAVGSVLAGAILIGLAVFLYLRWRKGRTAKLKSNEISKITGGEWHQLDDQKKAEMQGSNFWPVEAHGRDVKEVEGTGVARELDAGGGKRKTLGPAEMPG